MKATPAKKVFKKRFGQANHFLITTLVGLDGIQTGIIREKSENFSTLWSPKDPKRSAERSRVFVLKSFLGWAVESLEMYMTELNRKPKLLESDTFTVLFSKAGQSIFKKTTLIADEIQVDPILTALMEVLITWRNYTFHYDVDNEIREKSLISLLENAENIKERFSGLDISQLKITWETGGDFTFKETATLIRATHDFINEIDSYILSNLDNERYFVEAINKHFTSFPKSQVRFKSLDNIKKVRFIKVLLQNLTGEIDFDDSDINTILCKI